MKIVVIAGAAALSCAAPVSAQTVSATDPPSIAEAMQDEGYRAKLDTDTEGNPRISSSASGNAFHVNFYGCTDHKECVSIQFRAGYDVEDGKGPSLRRINEWNETKRYAQASLDDEGDPWITMDVFTSSGGISGQVFKGNFSVWTELMAAFEDHIDWSK